MSCENGDARKRKSSEEGEGEAAVKSPKTGVRCRGYYSSKKGERDEMQDYHVIIDDYAAVLCEHIQTAAFYAVYDGHNGDRASKYCAQNLHTVFATKLPKGPTLANIEQALKRVFIETYKKMDEGFLSEASKQKPVWKDGSTSTTLFILNNSLFVANLGDSRAILCRSKPEENKEIALTLTKDHSPQIFEERMRIQKTGATVKDGRILGILEVSRSIGDGQYKKHGVSCIPDVKKCTLTPNDRYVVIACDGLWKSFTNQQVIEFVAEKFRQLENDDAIKESVVHGKEKEAAIYDEICCQLAAEAVRRGSGDNVTVLIVLL